MSELDVHQVICPAVERERDDLRVHLRLAEQIVLNLRRRLIAADPSLPDPYDGTAWAVFEGGEVT